MASNLKEATRSLIMGLLSLTLSSPNFVLHSVNKGVAKAGRSN